MPHGDLVTLTPKGVLLSKKAAETVGIYDQSVCWGVWYQNPIEDGFSERLRDHRHLVVSPLHPRSWPFLLRCEIWIQDRPGVLATVCSKLNELGLSILLLECTPSGFGHATCNIIAEVIRVPENEGVHRQMTEIRERKQQLDRAHLHPRTRKHAQRTGFDEFSDLFARSAAIMLWVQRSLRRSLESELADSLFQGDRSFSQIYELSNKVAVAWRKLTGDVDDGMGSMFPKALSVEWIAMLSVFAFFGGGRSVPIPFRYRAGGAFLALEAPVQIDEPEAGLGSRPISVLASFNQDWKYIRLDPITSRRIVHQPTRIEIDYRVDEPGTEHGIGLFQKTLKSLGQEGVDVLHVVNKWTQYRSKTEAGRVAFICDAERDEYEELRHSIRATESKDTWKITRVRVEDYSVLHLFLSLHFGHPRQKQMIRVLRRAAGARGFQLVVTRTAGENVPERIEREIGAADAVLQLLCFREDEDPEQVSFPWLDYEFGLARGLRAPVVRLVDEVRRPLSWWDARLRIHRDLHVMPFRSDVSEQKLKRAFRQAVKILARLVAERHS